jgi:hypothetical protein
LSKEPAGENKRAAIVIPGLARGIQLSIIAGVSGTMDPSDKHQDDNVNEEANGVPPASEQRQPWKAPMS